MIKNIYILTTFLFCSLMSVGWSFELIDFTFLSDSIDVTDTPQELEFEVIVTTEDLLVFQIGMYNSPDTTEMLWDYDDNITLIGQSGNETTYHGVINIPQFIEEGTYIMTNMTLYESWYECSYENECLNLNTEDFIELGIDCQIEIICDCDFSPPNLIDFSISPNIVDVTYSEQIINYQIQISDESGLEHFELQFHHNNNNNNNNFNDFNNANGQLDTIYNGEIVIPMFIQPGIYEISVFMSDINYNNVDYHSDELATMGFPYEILVQNNAGFDSTPPSIIEFEADDENNIITNGEFHYTITVFEDYSDDINVYYWYYCWDCENNYYDGVLFWGGFSDSSFQSNSSNSVTYYESENVSNYPSGTYLLEGAGTWDGNGNSRDYNTDELYLLGFPMTITIINGDEPLCTENEIEIFNQCFSIYGTNLISFSNQGISGSIPPEIWNFPNLQHLYLDNNEFVGEIPSEISNLTYLETLYLNNNQLTGEIPTEIDSLGYLRNLNLSYNELAGSLPNNYDFLYYHLDLLLLNDNNLTGFIDPEICEILSRGFIDLSNNKFCPPYPDCLSEEELGYQDTSECEPFCELGDYNCDDIINVLDIVGITNMILADEYNEIADMNEDGQLNILDIVMLVNLILEN